MKRFSSLMNRMSKVDEELIQAVAINKEETLPVLLLGPRGSGKTSFLYKSYFRYTVKEPNTQFNVIPTPSHNVEIIPFKSISYELWDFAEISSCLNHIKDSTRIIIYFMDSIELHKDAVESKSRENMIWLLENFSQALENTMIITVANKQLEDKCMDIQDIAQLWLNDKTLMSLLKGHDWRIFPCNSVTGEGIEDVFEYITTKQTFGNGYINQEQRMSLPLKKRSSSILLTPSPSIMTSNSSIGRNSSSNSDLATPWDNFADPCHLTDPEFFQWFYSSEKQFIFFNNWSLVRIIFLTITDKRKKKKSMFDVMHQQLKHQILHAQDDRSIQYSETQTLFWTQMVTFALLKSPLLEEEKNNHFDAFLKTSRLEEDCWKLYYSQKVFYSERAQKEFLAPDKKSLPNAFKSSSLALKGSGLRIDYQVL